MKRIALLLAVAGCSGLSGGNDPAGLTTPRPVDPHKSGVPTRTAAGQTMLYFGGPVISNAKVYVVWWGNPANLPSAVTAAHGGIADFYAGVTNSNFVDWFNEYNTTINANAGSHSGSPGTGQRIGRGNYVGTATLSNIPSGNVTDAQIQSTLDAAFVAGTLPPPDENSIYAIYFPGSVSISLPDGSSSCLAFGAYHDATVETARHPAYYLVMPDCGDSFAGVTNVSSHELAEAITDGQPTPGSNPNYPQAWNDSSGSEVGDLCQSYSGTVSTALGSFTVQGIWDERSQGCLDFRHDAQDFNVAIAPNSGSLASGASAAYTVSTATVAGAAQTLALSVVAPAGVTASLSPTTVTSGQSATLTVTASGAARSGLQVVVRADGVQTHTAALLLAVTGTAGNDFSISAAPASVSVVQGHSASSTISTAVASGSAGAVTLSASVSPAGPTASLSATSITAGNSATLSISAGTGVAPGTYTVTVTGVEGSTSHAATVAVTVTAPAANDFSISASPASLGIAQGASGTSAISTALVSGSAGAVALSASVSPAGPTASLSAASVTAGGSATLTVSAPSGVAAGNYTVTVTGNEAGVTHAASVAVIVTGTSSGGIVNGGFESGLAGWTSSGSTSAIATAHAGSGAAQVGSLSPSTDSALSQTFTAPAGAAKLSFWYQVHCPDTIQYDWASATLKDNTAGQSAVALANTCSNTGAWQQASASVTPGHSYTLTLASHDDNYAGDPTYTWFDDVALSGAAASDFSLSVAPAALSVQQGASGTATVATAVVSGSAQSIALSASGLPAGVSATFSPASLTAGGSATLTLAASSSAAAGSATITITGTAASGAHAATLSLTVTAPSSGGGVTNGGFETGALSGWTASGTTAAVNSGAHSGTYAARLGSTSPTSGDSSIVQTFAVPTGKSHLVFWYRNVCPDTVTYDWATANLRDNTAGTSATVLAKTCTASGAWTQKSAAVTAGHSYTLTLTSHDDNYAGDATYTLYDDIGLQ